MNADDGRTVEWVRMDDPHSSGAGRRPPRRLTTFDALSDPTFRRLFALGWAYYTYRAVELTVLSWFVLTFTDSALAVALVGVSRIAPMFMFGLLAGSFADRFARIRMIRLGQGMNLAASTTLLVLLVSGVAEAWHAYAAILVTGTTWAIDYAARRALLGDVFQGPALTNATALDSGLVTGSNFLGPLVGTVLIRVGGFASAYAGIVILTVAGLALVLSMKVSARQPRAADGTSPGRQVRDAVLLVRGNRAVLATVLLTAVFNFFGWPFMQVVPVISRDILGASEIGYGVLVSALGLGALCGSVAIATVRPSRQGSVFSLGAMLIMASAGVFAWAPMYSIALACMFIGGLGLSGFAVMQPVIPLGAVASELRGRAMGAVVLSIGAQAPGMLVMGALADAIGPRESVSGMAAVGILILVWLRLRYPVLRDIPDRPTQPILGS
jgi:MFS family permease